MAVDRSGVVLLTDARGELVPQAAPELIPRKWQPPVERVAHAYDSHLGAKLHSVYLRGGLPLGSARDGRSDIDTIAVVHGPEAVDRSWVGTATQVITKDFPFVADIEIVTTTLSNCELDRTVAATIKTQGTCIFGQDLTLELPGVRPGIDLVAHGWDLPRDLTMVSQLIAGHCEPEVVSEICEWIMKRIVRTGFEVVMGDAQCFTRDLYPATQFFSSHFPQFADAMWRCLELAVSPTNSIARLQSALSEPGPWLFEQLCHTYGADRIARSITAQPSR